MIQLGLIVELLAILALIVGVPVPIAGTVALIAATPTTAIAILRILKINLTASDAVDIAFLFFTWVLLPCLLVLHAKDGVGENVFRFIIAARFFAAASIWRLSLQWKRVSADRATDGNDHKPMQQRH